MKKVVMAVNNPATIDYRVVKTAEMVARSGYECHVIGIWKPGFKSEETINGVTYHRIPIKTGMRSLLLGFFPSLISYLYTEERDRKNLEGVEGNNNFQEGITSKNIFMDVIKRFLYLTSLVFALVGSFFVVSVSLLVIMLLILLSIPIIILQGWIIFAKLILDVFKGNDRKSVFKTVQKRFWKDFGVSLKITVKNFGKYLAKLQPNNSPVGVRYLQGRYLGTFYYKLLALDGDIYHAHELWPLESCAMVAKRLNRKLVYDSHELEPYRNNNWTPSSNKVRVSHEKRYIHNANEVFAVSNGCAKEIKKIYSLRDVHLLRNTPMLSKIKLPSVGLRKKIGLDNDTPLMIYTGLMTINRGLETIIESLKNLPSWHLATVGPWNDEVKKALIQLAEEEGVLDRFHIHEKVPPEELIEFISDGDLAVVPIVNACLSYYYCLPNKIFEAAFAGLPVVVSDLPDMKQFVEENRIGKTFQDGNAKSLADAVLSVSKDDQYSVTPEGKEDLRNKYCFEQEVKALLAVYQQLIPVETSVLDAT